MAFEVPVFDAALKASPNASSGIGQFCAVKLDTAGGSDVLDCIPATANTDAVIGINQDVGGPTTTLGGAAVNVSAGLSMRVRQLGITKAQIASAVTRGDLLVVSGSSGQLATAPALAATSVRIVGQALQSGTNAGDIITVLLTPMASSIVNA
jgi:hypothetical protein